MEDLNYQQTIQNTTSELEYMYILPLIFGFLLIFLLFLKQYSDTNAKVIKICLSLLYIYSGIAYCSLPLASMHIIYAFLLILNLESLANHSFSVNSNYLIYSNSKFALIFPFLILFSGLLPDSNYFPSPYLLSAYSYCIVNRFKLIINKEKNKKLIRIHVRII